MTRLVDEITELLIIIPHLASALERDSGTTSAAGPVSGGTDPAFALPLNADVFSAIHALDEVHGVAAWAADTVGEPRIGRDIEGHLRQVPRWHERMLVTGAAKEAAQLAAAVHSLSRQTKLALGLRTADRRLGQYCPLHDEALTELVAPGDEARLRYTRLDAAGQPVMPTVEWRWHAAAMCRLCKATWAPSQYLLLSRQLEEADARRLEAAAEGAAS